MEEYYSVLAIPTGDNWADEPMYVGVATSKNEALDLVAEDGLNIISEDNGGIIDYYDIEDSKNIFGDETRERPAIIITVESIDAEK